MMIDKTLMNDMMTQSRLYQPSSFWRQASIKIMQEFANGGIERFRSLPTALSFFVPTYGFPGNGLNEALVTEMNALMVSRECSLKQQATVQQFLNGHQSALADYRVLMASQPEFSMAESVAHGLKNFSESAVGEPIEQFEFDSKRYSRSALNYLLGLSFLSQYAGLESINTVLEIGGGFGTLGEITQKCFKNAKYIDIDIPPTLFAADYYLKETFGEKVMSAYEEHAHNGEIFIENLNAMTLLPAWKIEQLQGKVDLFVNFISFQEMEPAIVQNYLNHVSRLQSKWVLLRNMREGKQVKQVDCVGVEKPILSDDYINMLPEYELVETNVWPFGFKTVDEYHSELMLFKRRL